MKPGSRRYHRDMPGWIEVGERVFVRRYAFLDQAIGLVVGDDGVLVVDTRATLGQAQELRRDVAQVSTLPILHVVNTHGHADHAFANGAFRPAAAWAHARCPAFLRRTAADQWAWLREAHPLLADDLAFEPGAGEPGWTPDLPERLVSGSARIDLGGHSVELHYLGRGHTDHDLVLVAPDARVAFAGDLVENGAPPQFDDAFPLDWATTLRALIEAIDRPSPPGVRDWVVVPGHGDPVGPGFVRDQAALLDLIASLGRAINAGQMHLEDAVELLPFATEFPELAQTAFDRTLEQLRGELMLD